jgi:hypothetical protein
VLQDLPSFDPLPSPRPTTPNKMTAADRVLSVRPWVGATLRGASSGGSDAPPSPREAAAVAAAASGQGGGLLFEAQEVDLLLSFARSSTRAAASAAATAAAGGAGGGGDGDGCGDGDSSAGLARLPCWWETSLWDPLYVTVPRPYNDGEGFVNQAFPPG